MPLPEIYSVEEVAGHLTLGKGFVVAEAQRLG